MSEKKDKKNPDKSKSKSKFAIDTKLMHLGRNPDDYFGVANLPVSRASTIMYPSLEAYDDPHHKFRYARMGSPMSEAFESAVTEMEGGYNAVCAPSGLSAITTTLLAFVKSGDHILVADSIYPPTRIFCDDVLVRMGVEVEYYDSLVGADIARLFRDNTSLVYMESPGSATYEIQDVRAITAQAAKSNNNILTVLDNSWASSMLFKPIEHGVNISVLSATKYISGHSDISLGVAVADNAKNYNRLKRGAVNLGTCAGADDLWLALRGLRTISVRMKQNAKNALEVANWLQQQKDVIKRVYHPALPGDSNHELWKRDFSGSNGLITILMREAPQKAVSEFVNSLELFPIGSSWGGYESLLQPQHMESCRTAVPWTEKGACLRVQIGLEDPQDLINDLALGLDRFRSNCK